MKKSTNKKVFERFNNNSVLSFRFSAIITAIVILIYTVGVLIFSNLKLSSSNIVSFVAMLLCAFLLIMVVVPFLYSYMAMNIVLNSPLRNDVKVTGFFKTATIGFQRKFRRCMPVLKSIFIAIAVYIVSNFVLVFILYFYLGITSSEFNDLINQYVNLFYSLEYSEEAVNAILNQIISLVDGYADYIFLGSTFFAVFAFLRTMLRGIFRFYFIPIGSFLPDRVFDSSYRQTMKSSRKSFNFSFRSLVWILDLIYIFVFVISSILLLKFTKIGIVLVVSTSGVLALVFNLPFVPLLFNKYEEIIPEYVPTFIDKTVERVKLEINVLKENYDMFDEQEKEEADKLISSQEEIIRLIKKASFNDFTGKVDNGNKKSDS